jgi:hypothetical protein
MTDYNLSPSGKSLLDVTQLFQRDQDAVCCQIRGKLSGIEHDLGILRLLLGIIDTGKAFQQPCTGFGIETFTVSLLTYFDGCGPESLHKTTVRADHLPDFSVGSRIRRNRRINGNTTIFGDFTPNKADATYIQITMLF